MKTVGQKLKFYRKRAGLSQLELENLIGASHGSLSRFENGSVDPSKETLRKIIGALNLKVADSLDILELDSKEFFLGMEIIKIIHTPTNIDDLLKILAEKVVNYINGVWTSFHVWDEDTKSVGIHAKSINVPLVVKSVLEKGMGKKLSEYRLSLNDPKFRDNKILECIEREEIIQTKDLTDLARGAMNQSYINLVSKLLKIKLCVAVPLVHSGKKLGVMNIIVWKKSLSQQDLKLIKVFAEHISLSLYKLYSEDG